jgi:hypothetical protein
MEYVTVVHLIIRFCPVCEILKNASGDESGTLRTYRLITNEYPQRDKLKYQRALVSGGSHCLKQYGLYLEEKPFWHFLASDPYQLW